MSSETGKKKFSLRPRARIVKTFGEELISNDYVAIIELVKNSYDADARLVEVKFEGPLEKGKGQITITDNGLGMSPEEVEKGWMEPASIGKLKARNSPTGRPYLGQKGVGRFSTAKLAERLLLTTRKKDSSEEVEASFNWSDYYDPDKYLDQVEGTWEIRNPNTIDNHGTILEMSGLLSSWDKNRVTELKTQLRRLVNPVRPPEDFKIWLNFSGDLQELSGEITPPESMQRPDYKVTGKLTSDGHLFVEYSSRESGKTRILKDEKIILVGDKSHTPQCGAVSFEFRVWDRDTLSDLATELGKSIGDVRKDLDAIAGVSIYRDGFRVSPYGNRDNDWLRLNYRRVQNPTMRISSNQVIGDISISGQSNPMLQDQTNREGIVESDSFRDLREVTLEVLALLERERYAERRSDTSDQESRASSLMQEVNLDSVRQVIEAKLPDDKEAHDVLAKKEKEIKDKVEELHDVVVRYRRLSTLGQLVDVILHDAGNSLSKVNNGLSVIDNELKVILKDQPSEKIGRNIVTAKAGAKLLSELFKRLEPFGGRRREKAKVIAVEDAIKDVFKIYEQEIDDSSITVSLPSSRNEIKISESDFKQVFINLLNNSIYWLKKADSVSKEINVKVDNSDGYINVFFQDNGPGISAEDASLIFDPYYSKKPNGIGLGLTIVGELIEELGGKMELVETNSGAGACFKLSIPDKG